MEKKKKTFLAHFLKNFSSSVNEILCAAMTQWFIEAYDDFLLFVQLILKRKNPSQLIFKNIPLSCV